MDIKFLIDTAKEKSGMTLGAMADEMHISQVRISEWKKGKYRPSASDIAYLAEKARFSVLETLAELEAQQRPELAAVWQRALNQVRKLNSAAL